LLTTARSERISSRDVEKGSSLKRAVFLAGAVATLALLVVGEPGVRSLPRSGEVEPVPLRAAISAALGSANRGFWIRGSHGVPRARGGGLSATFGPTGPTIAHAGRSVRIDLQRVGSWRVPAAQPVAKGSHVVYRRENGVSESYRNGPLGLEQVLTLERRPARAAGHLTVAFAVTGHVQPSSGGPALTVTASGVEAPLLRYGGLAVTDARHHSVRARLASSGGEILLRIDDSHERYPLRIDPLIQQAAKLTPAAGGEIGKGQLGTSAALSADGSTAIVGGPVDSNQIGAAWVFVRSGGVWTQQGPKLTASDGSMKPNFGRSVTLSADGNTAAIGGYTDNNLQGAAWVFTRLVASGPSRGRS